MKSTWGLQSFMFRPFTIPLAFALLIGIPFLAFVKVSLESFPETAMREALSPVEAIAISSFSIFAIYKSTMFRHNIFSIIHIEIYG